MTKDLTQGSPVKNILGFAVPVLFGFLFQQFYSLVDTIIVGKCLGVDALAGVGSTSSVSFLIIGFVVGVCSGLSIPVAQRFGAKDYVTMRQYIANAGYLAAIFAIIMTTLTVTFCRTLLLGMLTPENILENAYNYIVIIFWGIPLIFLYNMLAGIIRSIGDSKTPVFFLIFASIINIGLDLFFILGLKTKVGGAALATVISQGFSGLLCLFYMKKKYAILAMSKDECKLRIKHFSILCSSGVPMGLQYSITAIGSVILQTAVNTLGSAAVAAITAGIKLQCFFTTPFDALGNTMTTFAGQNTGAGKLDRVKSGVYSSTLLGFTYSAIAFILLFFFGKELAYLFVEKSQTQIVSNARLYLLISSGSFTILTLLNIFRFTVQGMGFGKLAINAGIFEMIARTVIAVFVVPRFGFFGACLATPLAWGMAVAFLVPAFFYCYRKLLAKA